MNNSFESFKFMPKTYSFLLILTSLIFLSGCETTSSNSIQSSYTVPTVLETPVDLPIVESLPEITELEENEDESLIFKNDRLIVRKTLIDSDQVGGEIIYEITLEVLKDVENLWIEERIPDSFQLNEVIPSLENPSSLIWHFSKLIAGDTQAIAFNFSPMDKGTHEVQTLVRFEQSLNLSLFSGQPELALELVAPSSLERNTSGTWEVIISNTGSAVAKAVNLTANFSDAFKKITPLNYSIYELDMGASRSFSFEADALEQGLFENSFLATYENSVPETEALAQARTQIVQSGIQIETLGPLSAYVFKPQNYKINIRNTGDTDLENVRITQIVSENYSILDSGRGRINENAIGWMIPRLPAGSNQLITTQLTANRPGAATVKTVLKTDKTLTASDQTTTEWLAVPGVTLSIVDSKDPITVGETTELSIRVRNQGEFEPVKGQIEISFSEHLKPLAILNDIEGSISDNKIVIPEVLLKPGNDIVVTLSAEGIQMGSGRTNLNFMADFLNNPVINQESTNIY
ncbi:MAG: hypothetical protein ACJZ9B_05035 [Coraliomargaritaceae bacterium]